MMYKIGRCMHCRKGVYNYHSWKIIDGMIYHQSCYHRKDFDAIMRFNSPTGEWEKK